MRPFDPAKPVQTLSGEPARILCTDRDHEYAPIVALVGSAIFQYRASGEPYPYSDSQLTLVNTWFVEAKAAGMKVNPGTGGAPDDFDDTREILRMDGTDSSGRRWTLTGSNHDVALYWPKPRLITLELTPEQAVATKVALGQFSGGDNSLHPLTDEVYNMLPGATWKFSNQLLQYPTHFLPNSHKHPSFLEAVRDAS